MKTDIHNHLLRTVTPVQVISLDNYQRKQNILWDINVTVDLHYFVGYQFNC